MKIYKYEIEIKDRFYIILPERSKILSIQLQNNIPMLWAAVTEHSTISYNFSVYGTGHEIDNSLYHKYISTLQIGSLVWHIFQIANINTLEDKYETLDILGYF
jgi:hypothetical protein